MEPAADKDEQTRQHAPQTRSEALVIIPRSAPFRKPVFEEMVVPFAFLPVAEDVHDDSEPSEPRRGFFVEELEFARGRFFGSRFRLREEDGAGFVGVEKAGLFFVSGIEVR